MEPLIYGFMQLDPEAPDNDTRQLELVLKYCAETAGYCYATTFHEGISRSGSGRSAFAELIEELKRSEARHVIVPSIDHFSAHPLVRTIMLLKLATEAHAQVHTLSTHQPTSTGRGQHVDTRRLDRGQKRPVVLPRRREDPTDATTRTSTAQSPNGRRRRLVGLPTDAPPSNPG